jgi:transcriptional regulator with XRE-family HTH domain
MDSQKKKPNPVDVHVGTRVRLRRTLLGMSQGKLGNAMGLTFQQVQKYERGANRIGASRLYTLSQALDVPVSFFFVDMSQETAAQPSQPTPGFSDGAAAPYEADPMGKRETLELVRAYYGIGEPKVRKNVLLLMRSLRKG